MSERARERETRVTSKFRSCLQCQAVCSGALRLDSTVQLILNHVAYANVHIQFGHNYEHVIYETSLCKLVVIDRLITFKKYTLTFKINYVQIGSHTVF